MLQKQLWLIFLLIFLVACGGEAEPASETDTEPVAGESEGIASEDETEESTAVPPTEEPTAEPTEVPPTPEPKPTLPPPTPEPTGEIAIGWELTLGVSQFGHYGGLENLWMLDATTGQVFNIFITPEGEFDVVVDVVDGEGNSILPNGAVDESFGEEQIVGLTVPETGRYYISINAFNEGDEGSYELLVADVTTAGANEGGRPAPNSDEWFNDTPLAYPALVEGFIPANGRSYFFFEAGPGQSFHIDVMPKDGIDVVFDVLDTNGNSILPNGAIDASFGDESVTDLAIVAEDIYTIVVTEFNGTEGTYELRVVDLLAGSGNIDNPDTGSTDFWLGSGVFAPGVALEGFIPENGLSSWTIEAQQGEVYSIFVTPKDGIDVVVDVVDVSGNTVLSSGAVDSSLGEESVIGWSVPYAGSFAVHVTEYNNQSGYYDIIVAEISGAGETGDPYGNMYGGAGPYDRIEGPYTLGSGIVVGTIPDDGTASLWGLRTNPGDVIAIRVDPLDGQDVVIDVREGSTGQSIFEGGPHDLELGSELITGLYFPNGGDYSIVIYGFSISDSGRYELLIIEGE